MKSIIVLTLILLAGCSSTEKLDPVRRQRFADNFSDINEIVGAKYFRNFQTYEGMTYNYYESMLETMKLTAKLDEFRKDFRYFDVRRVESTEKAILVCVYSNYFNTGLCDITKCPGTEEKDIKSEKDIGAAMSKLLANKCSK